MALSMANEGLRFGKSKDIDNVKLGEPMLG
jgi:hypothetical protein